MLWGLGGREVVPAGPALNGHEVPNILLSADEPGAGAVVELPPGGLDALLEAAVGLSCEV
jgi:hypothetical protein